MRPFSTSIPRASAKTGGNLTYHLSAAYSDKKHKLDLSHNHFTYSPSSKDNRGRAKSGQDSYFIAPVGETSTLAFGVVDGVGGWEESGVDPADFAHGLCDYMADAARRFGGQRGPKPVELLDEGYEQVMKDESIAAGGCTACIATVTDSGLLSVAKYVFSLLHPILQYANEW
jgi:protein phosphatase PTC7